jgi:DNA-binding NarL/FixJ family response regulator
LLALVDADDEQAVSRLRAALPDACFLDLTSSHSAQVPTDTDSEELLAGQIPLTHRQSEILALMLDGLSNKAIGRQIGISHFTVRNHVSKLMQILNVPTRRDIRRALHDVIPISVHGNHPNCDRPRQSLGVRV